MTALKKLFVLLITGLILTGTVGSVSAKIINDSKDFIRKQIVGTWQLKQSATGVKSEKIKNSSSQIFLVAPSAPKSLVLAADENFGEITINEWFEKVIHTQTLPINRDNVNGKLQDNGAQVKAFWQNKKLIVEAVAANGTKMTETFELGTNKNQLKVTTKLEDEKISKPIVTRRIYNRAADEPSGSVETNAEINVSQYLL